jgi:Family of unknown function (DUF6476)
MRGLRIFVIVMGIVIVVGFGVVIAVIAGRMGRREMVGAAHAFAGGTVEIPAGARVEVMTATSDRLVLDLALPDGAHQIMVFDLATGARLGTIELRPADH